MMQGYIRKAVMHPWNVGSKYEYYMARDTDGNWHQVFTAGLATKWKKFGKNEGWDTQVSTGVWVPYTPPTVEIAVAPKEPEQETKPKEGVQKFLLELNIAAKPAAEAHVWYQMGDRFIMDAAHGEYMLTRAAMAIPGEHKVWLISLTTGNWWTGKTILASVTKETFFAPSVTKEAFDAACGKGWKKVA